MDWLLINSKAPKTDIILAMHAVLVRHHEAETNIYGCNMYIIGGIKKFNRVPVTPFLSLLSKHWSWRGLHFVITIVRDLLVFFFFFSAYPFSFLSFSGRKCNKKNLHWREETWQSWTEFAHFSWCMLPKKKNTCQGITQKHFKSWRFHFTWWFSRSFSIKYSVCTCQGELTNFNKTLKFCSIL